MKGLIFGILTDEIDAMKLYEPLNDIDYKLHKYWYISIVYFKYNWLTMIDDLNDLNEIVGLYEYLFYASS